MPGNNLVSNLEKTDRAKIYASNIESLEDSGNNFNFEKLWQVHKKYIISEINSVLLELNKNQITNIKLLSTLNAN